MPRQTVAGVAQELEHTIEHLNTVKEEVKELDKNLDKLQLRHELLEAKSAVTEEKLKNYSTTIGWFLKLFGGVFVTGFAAFILGGGLS